MGDESPSRVDVGDVHDQWIGAGPALSLVNQVDGGGVGGIRAQAVNRFGGKGDQASLSQEVDGAGDVVGEGGHPLRKEAPMSTTASTGAWMVFLPPYFFSRSLSRCSNASALIGSSTA